MSALLIFAGFILGVLSDRLFRKSSNIDLDQENRKLRKENEVLWSRLKSENKIDKF